MSEPIPPPLPVQQPSIQIARNIPRRRSSAKLYAIIGSIIAVLTIIGIAITIANVAPKVIGGDPAKAAVRRYLRENLNDPNFEEIQWRVGKFRFAGSQNFSTFVGLKYRAKNGFGATTIRQDVFEVNDGEVTFVHDDMDIGYVK